VKDPGQAYVARRTAEGKNPREIRRCLKRYIARRLYRTLTEAGRRAYFAMQNELQGLGRQADQDRDAGRATPDEFSNLRNLAHELRQQLLQDLGTADALGPQGRPARS